MKLSDVTEGVEAIRKEGAMDDEGAHAAEDALHSAVLEAIAKDECEDCEPCDLAAAALVTHEIIFSRWYA